jgi:hypothetical protein
MKITHVNKLRVRSLSKSRKALASIVVVAIIVAVVVAVAAGAYLLTRDGSPSTNNPTQSPGTTVSPSSTDPVAGASSLQYSFSTTSTHDGATYTDDHICYVKNIGKSNQMLRLDTTYSGGSSTIYIVNGEQKKAWTYGVLGDDWISDDSAATLYGSALGICNNTFQVQLRVLASWSGSGEYIYNDPVNEETVRFYNIMVNPDLPDTLFTH